MDAPNPALFTPAPSPQISLWYVTNGQAVVGPVNTDLLLRGITHGRIPDDCFIAQPTWPVWRPLDQIREVRALYRERDEPPVEIGPPLSESLLFAGAQDDDALLKQALKLAVEQTHADVGMVHQDWPPHIGLVTTHAYGRGMKSTLARVLPWYDPAREAAQQDKVLLAHSTQYDWARAMTTRFRNGGPVKAVALVPVKVNNGHRTLIELGHFFHSFRREDAKVLDQISTAVSVRLEQLSF